MTPADSKPSLQVLMVLRLSCLMILYVQGMVVHSDQVRDLVVWVGVGLQGMGGGEGDRCIGGSYVGLCLCWWGEGNRHVRWVICGSVSMLGGREGNRRLLAGLRFSVSEWRPHPSRVQ